MRLIVTILAVLILSAGVEAANIAGYANHATEISIDLVLPGSIFDIGEPVPYELKVTNKSAGKVTLPHPMDDILLPKEYAIEITDEKGSPLPHPIESEAQPLISMGGMTSALAWGESVSYKGYINTWAILDKPGTYTITFKWNASINGTDPLVTGEKKTIRLIQPTEQAREKRITDAVKQLESADSSKKNREIIRNLAFTLDPRAIPAIVQALAKPGASYGSGQVLYLFRDRQAVVKAMIDFVQEQGISEPMVNTLSEFKVLDKSIVPLLEKSIKEGDTKQRAGALSAAGLLNKNDITPSLKQLAVDSLKDPEAVVRRNAVTALRFYKADDTIDHILPLAESDPDANVRNMAVMVLGLLANDKAVPLLSRLTSGTDKELVNSAVESLKAIGTPAAVKVLEQCAKSDVKSTCEKCRSALEWIKSKQHKTQQ